MERSGGREREIERERRRESIEHESERFFLNC